jgi:hypothetical protein
MVQQVCWQLVASAFGAGFGLGATWMYYRLRTTRQRSG